LQNVSASERSAAEKKGNDDRLNLAPRGLKEPKSETTA